MRLDKQTDDRWRVIKMVVWWCVGIGIGMYEDDGCTIGDGEQLRQEFCPIDHCRAPSISYQGKQSSPTVNRFHPPWFFAETQEDAGVTHTQVQRGMLR